METSFRAFIVQYTLCVVRYSFNALSSALLFPEKILHLFHV